MQFLKYQHVEKYGSDETEGILAGEISIFYKIDGTNTCVYLDEEENLMVGSRNKALDIKAYQYGQLKYFEDNLDIKEKIISL